MSNESISIYREIGVEPVVNCGSSRSFYGSSTMSDPVREAMVSASRNYVLMSELGDAVGKRLSQLTGAEWGMVTAGSAGGLALGAGACVAANDPLRMLRLPHAFNGEKRVALTPKGQRFAYDQGIRLAGITIIEVADVEAFKAALVEHHVVLVSLFGERDATASLTFDEILPLARAAGIPILVDAASEPLGNPERWTARGADLAVYSIGKLIRGPAAAGLLLGRKDLVQAAWFNGPPHQSFGRAMKIGKEEMMGAIAAVEQWFQRDHVAERLVWRQRLETIRARLQPINTLKLDLSELVGGIPRLRIDWAHCQPGRTFLDLRAALLARRPRVLIDDYGGSETATMISPFALSDDEAALVADVLFETFTAEWAVPETQLPPLEDISGTWALDLGFANGIARHELLLSRDGEGFAGIHIAPESRAEITAAQTREGVELQAFHMVEGNTVSFRFVATERADGHLAGFVEMGAAASHTKGPTTFGQFGRVTFSATRFGTNPAISS